MVSPTALVLVLLLVLVLVFRGHCFIDHEPEHEHDYEIKEESLTTFPSRISTRRDAARATSSL